MRLSRLAVAAALLAALPAVAAALAPAGPTGLVAVGFAPDAPLPTVGDALFGARVGVAVPALHAVVLESARPDATAALARLDPRVAYAEVDDPRAARATGEADGPNDLLWSSQWGPQRIHAEAAWTTTRGSHAVIVAVLDSGLATGHADFAGVSILPGAAFTNVLAPSASVTDYCGHGTHVTGTIAAATGNGVGIAGMADVTILPVKVLEAAPGGRCYGSWTSVSLGIVHAADLGARVISMSLGGDASSSLLQSAVRYAYARGALVVASSGNDGCVSDRMECVGYPAAYSEAMAVGCTTSRDARCSFSNGDPTLDIVAPGAGVWSTTPWGYASWSGTSMSAPHVSGVAALMASVNPAAPGVLLRQWIEETAEDFGAAGRDNHFGHGLVDAEAAVARAAFVATP